METRSSMSRSLHTNRDFEKLEPYEGKPSRTVLRGEEGSNALDLPDHWLGNFSYSVWLATTCYVITAIVYRALCGTKDTKHMDRSISTWGN